MSFPPGTEMFQFPGFASYAYVFSIRYPLLGGFPHSDIHGSTPARGSPWLFAACHVLHRLLVPRHPPNALIALENTRKPSTRENPRSPTMHRNHPHPMTPPDWEKTSRTGSADAEAPPHGRPLTQHIIRASEHIARPQDVPQLPQGKPHDHPVSSSSRARPETHQNLIHTFKRTTARHQVTQAPHRTARQAGTPQSRVIPHIVPNPISSPRR
jgi:hypothetical protein